jgi:hypothetical protein
VVKLSHHGLLLVVPVPAFVVVVPVAVVAATTLYFFELLVPLVGLSAVLAVALDRVTQFVFRLVTLSFTSFVSVVPVVSVVGPCREGRAHQTDDRQQGNAEYSDGTRHGFSL